jgi:Superfamily II DNA and RNA helicases
MLFSATLDGKISSLTGRLLKDPERIEIVQRLEQRTNIAQTVHYVTTAITRIVCSTICCATKASTRLSSSRQPRWTQTNWLAVWPTPVSNRRPARRSAARRA